MRLAWLGVAATVATALAGCLGDDGSGAVPADGGSTHPDGATGGVVVTVTAPTSGAEVARDALASDGSWVARVTFTANVAPPATRVDWMAGNVIRGTGLPPDYAYTATFAQNGAHTLAAVVHGANDVELARADVAVTILASTAENQTCRAQLDAIGVTFAVGPDTMGVPDPVTVSLPLLGVAFGRASLAMECSMALAFYRMTEVLVAHAVASVTEGGSGLYNYRCVSGGEAPPCDESGFSLHAFGEAYDIAQMRTSDGAVASFGTDWVVDTGPTCNAVSTSRPNQLLHDVVCDLFENGIYTVVLTPNFQAAQDYVHMDLTVGQNLIQ